MRHGGRILADALALNSMLFNLARFAGPMLAAALLASGGAALAFVATGDEASDTAAADLARAAGVPVLGDIELFARALAARPKDQRPRVVAITGTNGKSTTTALIGWVLKQAGLTVHVGGNIGIGVLALPEPSPQAVCAYRRLYCAHLNPLCPNRSFQTTL